MADTQLISMYCPDCMRTYEMPTAQTNCRTCKIPLMPLFDTQGALCREYLLARGFCCLGGCTNCPYDKPVGEAAS